MVAGTFKRNWAYTCPNLQSSLTAQRYDMIAILRERSMATELKARFAHRKPLVVITLSLDTAKIHENETIFTIRFTRAFLQTYASSLLDRSKTNIEKYNALQCCTYAFSQKSGDLKTSSERQ